MTPLLLLLAFQAAGADFETPLRTGQELMASYCEENDPAKAPDRGWAVMMDNLLAAEKLAHTAEQRKSVYATLAGAYGCLGVRIDPKRGSEPMRVKQVAYQRLLFEIDPSDVAAASSLALGQPVAERIQTLERCQRARKQASPEIALYIAIARFEESPTAERREALARVDFSKVPASAILVAGDELSDAFKECSFDHSEWSRLQERLYLGNELGMEPPKCGPVTTSPCRQISRFFRSIECKVSAKQ